MIVGVVWGGVVSGFVKVYIGVYEVIIIMMMSYIVIYFSYYLLEGGLMMDKGIVF